MQRLASVWVAAVEDEFNVWSKQRDLQIDAMCDDEELRGGVCADDDVVRRGGVW
jgi:hypothetical protein